MLAVAMLRAAGIPAMSVDGWGYTGNIAGGHGWVEAFVDGRWIIMDPTWDTTNTLENGRRSAQGGSRGVWFDVPLAQLSGTHAYQQDSTRILSISYLEFYGREDLTSFTVPYGIVRVNPGARVY
jgi:transglutaminase-like putative cysteine protease